LGTEYRWVEVDRTGDKAEGRFWTVNCDRTGR
jgi:hypothetical protein